MLGLVGLHGLPERLPNAGRRTQTLQLEAGPPLQLRHVLRLG
jgi:hypothetical protein